MKDTIVLTSLAAVVLFGFGGCMMTSMSGGHNEHSQAAATTVQKEVTSNGVKAEAAFPPLELKKETIFTLKVTDVKSGAPLTDVEVWFHASFTHQMESSHHSMEHHGGMMDSSSEHSSMEHQSEKDASHGVNYDEQLTDSAGTGIFTVPFTPVQAGEYVLAFHIVEDRKKIPEGIIIEQKMIAGEKHESHSSGGMMGSLGPYAIAVGAAMAAWMVYSLASGNSMF